MGSHTMVLNQCLHISKNLRISSVRIRCHLRKYIVVLRVDCRWLRMQHKWYGEQTLDPFNQLVPAVSLQCVFYTVASRHDDRKEGEREERSSYAFAEGISTDGEREKGREGSLSVLVISTHDVIVRLAVSSSGNRTTLSSAPSPSPPASLSRSPHSYRPWS